MSYHYSKSHYRLLAANDRDSDTPERKAGRARRNLIQEQIRRERESLFPVITAENFQQASDWQDARFKELSK